MSNEPEREMTGASGNPEAEARVCAHQNISGPGLYSVVIALRSQYCPRAAHGPVAPLLSVAMNIHSTAQASQADEKKTEKVAGCALPLSPIEGGPGGG